MEILQDFNDLKRGKRKLESSLTFLYNFAEENFQISFLKTLLHLETSKK